MSGQLRYCLRHRAVRTGAWSCALALGVAVVAAAFWWPVHKRVHSLQEQFTAARREAVDQQQLEQDLAVYARAQTNAARLQAKLAYAATQAQLVEDLAGLARSNDVRIVSEAYEEGRRTGTHGVLNADLAVSGTYRALRQFLDGVAALPSWSEIDAVELERAKEIGAVNGKVRVVTYRLPQQATK
jgi:Tfp pilus assembly protein PilO